MSAASDLVQVAAGLFAARVALLALLALLEFTLGGQYVCSLCSPSAPPVIATTTPVFHSVTAYLPSLCAVPSFG